MLTRLITVECLCSTPESLRLSRRGRLQKATPHPMIWYSLMKTGRSPIWITSRKPRISQGGPQRGPSRNSPKFRRRAKPETSQLVVHEKGLEPSRLSAPEPKACRKVQVAASSGNHLHEDAGRSGKVQVGPPSKARVGQNRPVDNCEALRDLENHSPERAITARLRNRFGNVGAIVGK